jgi:hypothetical protein
MEIQILDVAFVIAVTAFFKKQFGWENKSALIGSLVAAMTVALAGQLSITYPVVAPWINVVVGTFTLWLAAAGTYDLTVGLMQKRGHQGIGVVLN